MNTSASAKSSPNLSPAPLLPAMFTFLKKSRGLLGMNARNLRYNQALQPHICDAAC